MHRGVIYALTAAALFGAITPFIKILLGDVHPVLLAGLLYAGSGLGLTMLLVGRGMRSSHRSAASPLRKQEWRWPNSPA